MLYTKKDNVEKYLNRDLTLNEDALLEMIIEQVSGFIATYANRNWLDIDENNLPVVEERLYDAEVRGRRIFIDDFYDLSKIELLNAEGDVYLPITASSEFILYPYNDSPKYGITLRRYTFPTGDGRVRITAKFSSGVLPKTVEYVATRMASRFVERLGETGEYKRESIEGYTRELWTPEERDKDIDQLLSQLDTYKRIRL